MKPSIIGIGRLALVSGLAAGVVLASQQVASEVSLTRWDHGLSSAPGEQSSAPTTSARTCPGPELMGVKGAPDAAQQVHVLAARAPGSVFPDDPGEGGQLTLTAGGSTSQVEGLSANADVSTPTPVMVQATDGHAPGLAASQWWSSEIKDLRGLVTTVCPDEGDDLWLIAGGGAPGRQERLVLANSGANEVTVDVTVHGLKGAIAAPNGRGIVVPGRGRTVILLDAIAGGEASPAVHVAVRGGTVSAVLSDVWLDGSVAAGADASTPIIPASRQVMPGVPLSQPGVLRVAVPGAVQAVVSVRVVTADGTAPLPGGGVVMVPAGSTVDVPLADLPPATYAVEAVSDVPIVAAAFSQIRIDAAPGDFAWTVAAPAIQGVAGTPLGDLPAASTGTLVLTSTAGSSEAEVWSGDPSAQPRSVSVGPDRMLTVDIPATAGSVWVRRLGGDGELRAAVVNSSGEGGARLVSVMTLTDTVTVTVRSNVVPLP